MFKFFIIGLLCLYIIEEVSADGDYKCEVDLDKYITQIRCFNFKLDEKDIPLAAEILPSEYLSLTLIDCTGKIDETSFPNIRRLTAMSISGSTLDKLILPELPKMSSLEIKNSTLPKLVGGFKNVKNLESVTFDKNIFAIEDESFKGLDNLKTLIIHDQPVSLNQHLLKYLKNLQTLWINRANVKHIPKETFQNNPDLIDISLDGNPIKTIDEGTLDPLEKLETFSILLSELQTFDTNLTNKLKHLKELSIPARSVKGLDLNKLLDNCPNFSAFNFLRQDTDCPEIEDLQDQISKLRKIIFTKYTGVDKTEDQKSC